VLIKNKCLPGLRHACPVNSAMRHSLQFALNRALLKYLVPCIKTRAKTLCKYFGTWRTWPIEEQISARRDKFDLRDIVHRKALYAVQSLN